MIRTAAAFFAAWLLALLATPHPAFAEPLPVVASFSILGQVVEAIGGDKVKVHTLVGPDRDAHVYQPTPADSRVLAGAKVVVINGLGFEGWIERLVKASGTRAQIVVATRGIPTRKMTDAHGHGSGVDPHVWHRAPLFIARSDGPSSAIPEQTDAASVDAPAATTVRDVSGILPQSGSLFVARSGAGGPQ